MRGRSTVEPRVITADRNAKPKPQSAYSSLYAYSFHVKSEME